MIQFKPKISDLWKSLAEPGREPHPFNPQKIQLNAFLKEKENNFKALLGPFINLRYSLAAHLADFEADPEQLTQLMTILLSNAKKAMPQGGQLLIHTQEVVMPDVEAFPNRSASSYLLLTVSDSGKGIPTEIQSRIQELFSSKGTPKGSSFHGLLQAKAILNSHHAKLLFFSQTVRGTSFKIYFPLRKAGATEPATSPAAQRGTETLLFVEDDAMTRHIYTKFLRQRGYNVMEAQHGKEAFDVYENYTGHIHLLITDVVMPELNGRQLVDRVIAQHPQLKVLYISGFTKDAIIQRGILKPDMPFLEKPFGREELALRIRQLLDNKA